jgi:hypothetical protein
MSTPRQSTAWTRREKLGCVTFVCILVFAGIYDYCSRQSRPSADVYRREREITEGMRSLNPSHELTEEEKQKIHRMAIEADKLDHSK